MRVLKSNELSSVSGGVAYGGNGGLMGIPLLETQASNQDIITLPTMVVTARPTPSGAIVGSVTLGWGDHTYTYSFDTGRELAIRTVQFGVTLMALPLGGLPAIGIGLVAAQGMRSLTQP